jgi:hypothetical protein
MNTRVLAKTEKELILFLAILFHIHVSHPVIHLHSSKLTVRWGEKLVLSSWNTIARQKGSLCKLGRALTVYRFFHWEQGRAV